MSGRPLPLIDAQEAVLHDVAEELFDQYQQHGDQTGLPDGTGPDLQLLNPPRFVDARGTIIEAYWLAAWAKDRTQAASSDGSITFEHILTEEWAEAIAEDDEERLYTELVQVAAVAAQWAAAIRLRATRRATAAPSHDQVLGEALHQLHPGVER